MQMLKHTCAGLLALVMLVNVNGSFTVFAGENVPKKDELVWETYDPYGEVRDNAETNTDLVYEEMVISQDRYLEAIQSGYTDSQIAAVVNAFSAGPGVSTDISSAKIYTDELKEILEIARREADIAEAAYGGNYVYSYSYSQSTNIVHSMKVETENCTLEEYNVRYAEVTNEINNVIAEIPKDLSIDEKVLFVHDYLVYDIEYDYENYLAEVNGTGSIPNDSFGMYGALVDGVAVCAGYSYAFRGIMDRIGIECEYVRGDEVNHAWNVVKLEDGYWYQVDSTWDDPVYTYPIYDRLGYCGHSYFFKNDTQWSESGHGSYWDAAGVTCNGNTYLNTDFSNIKSKCYYIDGEWYYVMNNRYIYKGNPLTLSGEAINGEYGVECLAYYEDRFYYIKSGSIYSCKTDGTDVKNVNSDYGVSGIVKEFEISDGYLRYVLSGEAVINEYKMPEPEPLSVTITPDVKKVNIGQKVTLTAKATGGKGEYTYSFLIYNNSTKAWYRFNKEFALENSLTWKASGTGRRTFFVEAMDKAGTKIRSVGTEVEVVGDELAVTAVVDKSVAAAGEKVVITAAADGGSGSYTYSFLICNPTRKEWYRFNKTFSSKNSYTWTASGTDARLFYAEVKDSSGKIVRSEAVNVAMGSKDTLTVSGTASDYFPKVNETITVKAAARGGSGGYTYSFLMCNTDKKEWYRFNKTFKSSASQTWKASSVGNRDFYIEVKDSKGKVVRSKPISILVR